MAGARLGLGLGWAVGLVWGEGWALGLGLWAAVATVDGQNPALP